jgi:hypothetical protein
VEEGRVVRPQLRVTPEMPIEEQRERDLAVLPLGVLQDFLRALDPRQGTQHRGDQLLDPAVVAQPVAEPEERVDAAVGMLEQDGQRPREIGARPARRRGSTRASTSVNAASPSTS